MTTNPQNPLVLIRPGLILNRSQVTKAVQCGNYTHVHVGREILMEWDEDRALWNRLLGIEPPKEEGER